MSLSFFSRLQMALRLIFSRSFAEQYFNPVTPDLAQSEVAEPEPAEPKAAEPAPVNNDAALQLLGLMQKEGRLIDFLKEDIVPFSDAQVGAAARVVHQGLNKMVMEHFTLEPVCAQFEGDQVTLNADYERAAYQLIGNISGQPPFKGVLIHKGWRATSVNLPTTAAGFDFSLLAPAEVEL